MGQAQPAVAPKEKRFKNFQEVVSGYSKRLTLNESKRCPQCADPVCVSACPLGIDIPGFIRLLREGNIAGAYETIRQKNPLPAVCGRLCSAPCETACIEDSPIGIRALERYASDFGRPRASRLEKVSRQGEKIAVVGSGPSGLTASCELACSGFSVTLMEAFDKPGGMLRYGVPGFRMPRNILDAEIAEVEGLGVDIQTNFFLGETVTFDNLIHQGFQAVLLACGTGGPTLMDIPGTELGGVYYGKEFLWRIQSKDDNFSQRDKVPFILGDKVVVVGSGNTALDCARTARRLGSQVKLIFRRTEEEMRVRSEERRYAKEEGVVFESMTRPTEILSTPNGFVNGVRAIRMDYADVTNENQWELTEVDGSEFEIEADTVVIAVGHQPNTIVQHLHRGLEFSDEGLLDVDGESMMTSVDGVFACGNLVTGAGSLIEAMASGKKAAQAICGYLTD